MVVCKLRDLPSADFADICRTSTTLAEIIRTIGLTVASTAYRDVKRRIKRETINVDHIARGLGALRGKPSRHRSSLERVLASNNAQWIKRALLDRKSVV